jgi:hypothetical protein
MSVYVDSDDFKATLTLQGTTFADDDLDASLAAASAGVDKAQGRTYGKSEEPDVVRLYSPDSRELLVIDDLAEFTSLRVDTTGDGTWDTWTLDTDFRLEPLNAELDSEPFTNIRALATQRFPVYRFALVEITGAFGWPAPPQQIVEATSIIASQLVKRKRENPYGFVISGDVVAYLIRNDPQVSFLLNGLSRRRQLVSAQLG